MIQKITKIAFKGTASAIGVAVIVLTTLKTLDVMSGISMFGLGLAALAVAGFEE